jgi:hypothetical protein
MRYRISRGRSRLLRRRWCSALPVDIITPFLKNPVVTDTIGIMVNDITRTD